MPHGFSHSRHASRSHNLQAHRAPLGAQSNARPVAAYRQRLSRADVAEISYSAPELWHEPAGNGKLRFVVQPAGKNYLHPVTTDEVRARLAELPQQFSRGVEVVQLSRMTRKRRTFPCYGMQWGQTVYLYPIEASLVELYVRPPNPAQEIEARMFGAEWGRDGRYWTLAWTPERIRDFYLNNVLIHEVGHINDQRNSSYRDRERFANWFAIEYGYRASRGRRAS